MRYSRYLSIAVLLVLSFASAIGQGARVSFIKAVPKSSFYNTKDSVIAYPVFAFRNKALTERVNKAVKSDFYRLYKQHPSKPVNAVLRSLASEGLAEMGYEEIRSDDRFFSFVIYHEWIAAYPTYQASYYAFDAKSGMRLTIDSLLLPEKKKAFTELVFHMWKDSLARYRKELSTLLENREIDSTDYELGLDYTKDDCLQSYTPYGFTLGKDTLEILFHCSFPRVMRPLDPSGRIAIPFCTIREYLRPQYSSGLTDRICHANAKTSTVRKTH